LRNLQPRLHAIDGTLHARAALRGTWGAPDLRVVAQGRDVGLAHGRGARLDAHVQVSGTRAAPRPTGEAHLEGGLFGFRGDARRYEAALSLRIDGDVARLERLWLRGGGGTLEATGSARLDGLRPTQLALAAHAHDF